MGQPGECRHEDVEEQKGVQQRSRPNRRSVLAGVRPTPAERQSDVHEPDDEGDPCHPASETFHTLILAEIATRANFGVEELEDRRLDSIQKDAGGLHTEEKEPIQCSTGLSASSRARDDSNVRPPAPQAGRKPNK